MNSLRVLYQDRCAGILEETGSGYRFCYDPAWIASGSPAISLTLPVRGEAYESTVLFAFFDGLIPEGWLLDLAVENWKIDPRDRFALLGTFCRDCIGAVGVEAL